MEFDSFPGYSGSIVQLAWGILNRYGVCAPGPVPQALARHFAHPPRNTVLFLLDGLGVNILEKHLPPDSFLRRNQTDMLRSAFPPTTAAAATALETGRYPSQSGWLGWSIYWPPIDKNVALYPNTDDQGRPAADVHIGRTFLPVTPLTRQLPGIPACSASEAGRSPWRMPLPWPGSCAGSLGPIFSTPTSMNRIIPSTGRAAIPRLWENF